MRIPALPRTSRSLWAVNRNAAVAATLALSSMSAIARAQDTTVAPYAAAVASWIGLLATPGYEQLATDRIESATEGWKRDEIGNLVFKVGAGSPTRVVACGLDETGYVVSEITDDGYLRVHQSGADRHVGLWDQFHEGQRVVVWAVDRANPARPRNVPGVFAVRSNHLWRGRTADETPASIEDLYIDIGARTRAEAEQMGVDVLDPVASDWPEWTFAEYVAGPAAANRAGCAAVAAAAATTNRAANGQSIYIISAQKSFGWTGLSSALTRLGHVDTLTILGSIGGREPIAYTGPVAARPIRAPWTALPNIDVGAVLQVRLPARYAGTLAETVREQDIVSLFDAAARAGGSTGAPPPIRLAHAWTAAPPVIQRDAYSRYVDVLSKLADIYAVSGHEAPMRSAVQDLLPAWARDSAVVDTAGNLVLSMGPDNDTSVFVAHLDEIGFEVTRIARDGTVSLRDRGSFFPFLWEGQTALLHRPDDVIPSRTGKLGCGADRGGPLRGIFIPRDSSGDREPRGLTAWFGLDSAALVAEGVHVGSPVTSYKCSARLGALRFTARSTDDRAGDTALLLALDSIVPSKLSHKVIFAWSVREEGGLLGSKALAAELGPTVQIVHAVDTFVSSDSPMEGELFAHATLGDGAVVRALDNSSVAAPRDVDRVVRLARLAHIPLQVGVTNGGNDGSQFARYGAIDVALAWPLRYSHSPAEVIDLRDLRSLSQLIAAVAKAK
jgi:putative aminopeptidase FrvX